MKITCIIKLAFSDEKTLTLQFHKSTNKVVINKVVDESIWRVFSRVINAINFTEQLTESLQNKRRRFDIKMASAE